MNEIADIEAWLRRLRDAAPAIARAGYRQGAAVAREDGFRAVSDDQGLRVAFRGTRSMHRIPPAISQGMVDQWNRRAQ